MDAPDTVTEAVQLLQAQGYRTDFSVTDTAARCHACDVLHEPARLVVRRTFRFEGDSDPGDEAVVLGVECPACGQRRIIVSAYGPDADAELLAFVAQLTLPED